jgi:hypothetical protein
MSSSLPINRDKLQEVVMAGYVKGGPGLLTFHMKKLSFNFTKKRVLYQIDL